jgi:ribosomal protein S18 acetylase RimI-like enzyme
MATRIRPAEARDLPALAEFVLALARVHVELDDRRFVIPDGGARTFLEFFRGELERPEVVLLIAEDQATPVGYAFVRMEPASIESLSVPSAWLHDVYVDPAFRGCGVGRQLVFAAIESAQELGSASLMLGVSPANTQARQLYERLGMRTTMIEMRLDFD